LAPNDDLCADRGAGERVEVSLGDDALATYRYDRCGANNFLASVR